MAEECTLYIGEEAGNYIESEAGDSQVAGL